MTKQPVGSSSSSKGVLHGNLLLLKGGDLALTGISMLLNLDQLVLPSLDLLQQGLHMP